ncbi:hypothetical protein Tco_0033642 [Tanacetum coccineum]
MMDPIDSDTTDYTIIPSLRIILELLRKGAVEVKYGHWEIRFRGFVGVESAVIALTERIAELERDNRRLKDTGSVESVLRRFEDLVKFGKDFARKVFLKLSLELLDLDFGKNLLLTVFIVDALSVVIYSVQIHLRYYHVDSEHLHYILTGAEYSERGSPGVEDSTIAGITYLPEAPPYGLRAGLEAPPFTIYLTYLYRSQSTGVYATEDHVFPAEEQLRRRDEEDLSPTRIEIPESCLPPRKRPRLASPTPIYRGLGMTLLRHPGCPISRELDYGITDKWGCMVEPTRRSSPTARGSQSEYYDLLYHFDQETTIMPGFDGGCSIGRRVCAEEGVILLYRDRTYSPIISCSYGRIEGGLDGL